MRTVWSILIVLVLLVGGSGPTSAQDEPATEYAVKAAFLFNFAKFVEWPEESWGREDEPFVVCVLGLDPIVEHLEKIVDAKTIHGRPIEVRRVDHVAEIDECHMLYVSESERIRSAHVLRRIGDRPVLTVGDFPEFVDQGGVLGFVLADNRVRFVANPDSAAHNGVRLSSKLMKIALVPEERGVAR